MNLYTYRLQQGERVRHGVVMATSPAAAASRAISLQDVDLKLEEQFELTMEFSGRAQRCPHGKPFISSAENGCIRCRSAGNLAKKVEGIRFDAFDGPTL